MTTTGQAANGDASGEHPLLSEPDQRLRGVWPERIRHLLLGAPRLGESGVRFGWRLALYGPLAFSVVLFLVLALFEIEPEVALGLSMSYWLFIGVSQLLYLIPGIVLAFFLKRPGVAVGMLQGGGVIALVNAVAWVIGYYFIGVR